MSMVEAQERQQRAVYEALEYGDFQEAYHEVKCFLQDVKDGKINVVDIDWLNETYIELEDHVEMVQNIMRVLKQIISLED